MYQDPSTGVWETSLKEEKWAMERSRELAAEAFNRADPTEFDNWIEYNPERVAQFIADVIAMSHLTPAIRPLLEGLRERFIDDNWTYYEEDAWNELEEAAAYRETEDA